MQVRVVLVELEPLYITVSIFVLRVVVTCLIGNYCRIVLSSLRNRIISLVVGVTVLIK